MIHLPAYILAGAALLDVFLLRGGLGDKVSALLRKVHLAR